MVPIALPDSEAVSWALSGAVPLEGLTASDTNRVSPTGGTKSAHTHTSGIAAFGPSNGSVKRVPSVDRSWYQPPAQAGVVVLPVLTHASYCSPALICLTIR